MNLFEILLLIYFIGALVGCFLYTINEYTSKNESIIKFMVCPFLSWIYVIYWIVDKCINSKKSYHYDYVDLGLPSGTLWATRNVGAVNVSDYGYLFQYNIPNAFKYGDNETPLSTLKYTMNQFNSYKSYNRMCKPIDIANKFMSGDSQMPTHDDLIELKKNTTHSIERINGVKGMLLKSKINGKTLFFPFSGTYYEHADEFNGIGEETCIWSKTNFSETAIGNDYAYCMYLCEDGYYEIYGNVKTDGLSVRGVIKSKNK